ncbi:hypothetical protein AOLI_G00161230 [Acnodon oligacanthus]
MAENRKLRVWAAATAGRAEQYITIMYQCNIGICDVILQKPKFSNQSLISFLHSKVRLHFASAHIRAQFLCIYCSLNHNFVFKCAEVSLLRMC